MDNEKDLSTPATKADILRLENKMDQVIELQADVKWLKRGMSGAYAAILALFGLSR